jgi:two-component system sensor histidine kinase TctE
MTTRPDITIVLRADDSDIVYYQVVGPGGEFLSGERDLPEPPGDEIPHPGEVRLRDAEMRGIEIRVAYVWVRMPAEEAPLVLVQVAETREKRSVLATETSGSCSRSTTMAPSRGTAGS